MAKRSAAFRELKSRALRAFLALACGTALALHAAAAPSGAPDASPSAPVARGVAPQARIAVPRLSGHLSAKDIGLVINTADPYSVEVGEFYIRARKLSSRQVLRLALPVQPSLDQEGFDRLKDAIEARFNGDTQALALAWRMPYAVGCNSITGALALGFDPGLCAPANSCAPSKPSPYFNARTARPYTDLLLRPSMLLAAKDVDAAKRLIERGVKADRSLGLKGAPPVHAYFVATEDRTRSARVPLFPPAGRVAGTGMVVHVERSQALHQLDRVLVYETGTTRVDKLDTIGWVPGALADHLTSFGGQLDGKSSQMSVLEWIDAGATASYGTVSEPCAHPQKFPHPQVLLLNYLQGATAIEAYWKSVAWPLQGVFIGEPLAAPYARRP